MHAAVKSAMCGRRRERIYESRIPPDEWAVVDCCPNPNPTEGEVELAWLGVDALEYGYASRSFLDD